MRRHLSPTLRLWLFLVLLLPCTRAISLSQFQTIADFPDTCTQAYNSQINGCTASDFINGNPCSTGCMNGLQAITTLIDTACAGSQADPTTLIGMFFIGKGINALCPNYAAPIAEASSTMGESSTPSAVVIETSTLVASSLSAATTSAATSTHTPSTTSTPTPSTTYTPTPTTTASSPSSTTTSFTISVLPVPLSQSTTSTPSPLTTANPSTSASIDRPTFVKTAINDGSKTVLTSKADQTASTNPDAFGGGGSPFEISAGVKGTESASRVALLAVLAGLVWAV
ncbi:hypothetical protein LPUS_03893 [Lasallia pustulata]|uniref:Uncharacterized protein n=1 Tax=Lasallia pustulata TaxID=136370 RepID=A0A1W5CVW5_9LECA|nr:hypothetical protein LPUS_03893 [Lasallia pustulata]